MCSPSCLLCVLLPSCLGRWDTIESHQTASNIGGVHGYGIVLLVVGRLTGSGRFLVVCFDVEHEWSFNIRPQPESLAHNLFVRSVFRDLFSGRSHCGQAYSIRTSAGDNMDMRQYCMVPPPPLRLVYLCTFLAATSLGSFHACYLLNSTTQGLISRVFFANERRALSVFGLRLSVGISTNAIDKPRYSIPHLGH